MTDPTSLHPPTTLLSALCDAVIESILPLSSSAMNNTGTKLFGAAIFHKPTLRLVIADTNQESDSPLWHGETWTITQFFAMPKESRPDPKECIFLTTHEPCSLCINAIAWAGFDNFVYMWTYEETDELFGIPGDLRIWKECFYDDGKREHEGGARAASVDGKVAQRRPEYRLTNSVFVAKSFNEVLASIEDKEERAEWIGKVDEVKRVYGSLSPTFRERTGVKQVE